MELNLMSLASMPRPHPYLESLVCVCVCVWMLQQLTTLCMWVLRSSVCFPVCVCMLLCYINLPHTRLVASCSTKYAHRV